MTRPILVLLLVPLLLLGVTEAALDDITVRLLEDDVEFFCSAGDDFGSGTDIGCYVDEDKPLPPMLYTLEVKITKLWRLLDSPVELPTIKGLIFGGNDVCQSIE